MSLLDVKPEPISPKELLDIFRESEIATDNVTYVYARSGKLAYIFRLALDQLAALALRDRE